MSDSCGIKTGMMQGEIPSPVLFLLVIGSVMQGVVTETNVGIYWREREEKATG